MCGRYLIEIDDNELYDIIAEAEMNAGRMEYGGAGAVLAEYGGTGEGSAAARGFTGGEVFPGSVAPVIISGNAAQFMIWGFPSLAAGRRPHINARSETAATARTFSAAMASRRCLVPASGYYEWKALSAKKKEKYVFRLPGRAPIYMAGIYSGGIGGGRFAILTREAAPALSEIHDRMPVIFTKESAAVWLAGSPDAIRDALTDLTFSKAS